MVIGGGNMSFEKAKFILSKVLKQKGLTNQTQAAWVCHYAQKILDRKFAESRIWVRNFQNKTITIAVPNSSWAQEIQLKEEKILKKINQRLNRSRLARGETEMKLVERIRTRIE